MSTAAILLAAGASTRLGEPKQLLRIDGETLLRRAARAAIDAGCAPVVVVLGANAEQMMAEIAGTGAVAVINWNWQDGMASSLRAGLSQLSSPIGDVLLLVCDQPAVTASVLRALLDTHHREAKAITASEYANARGVPAVFSAQVARELLALAGDQGARSVIARDTARVASFPFPEAAIDIDTPEDAKVFMAARM